MHHAGSVPLSQVNHAPQPLPQQSTVAASTPNEAPSAEQRVLPGAAFPPQFQAGQVEGESQPQDPRPEDGSEKPLENALHEGDADPQNVPGQMQGVYLLMDSTLFPVIQNSGFLLEAHILEGHGGPVLEALHEQCPRSDTAG